jgi:hypothetical protein
MTTTLGSFTRNNLNRQGFGNLSQEKKARYAWPLRFTPAVGTALIVAGMALQSPLWLASMALVALSGAFWPHAMLIDVIYNVGVRHLFGAPALPPTPSPRRFSYVMSTVLLTGSAVSFYTGLPALGLVLGGLVVVGGTTLTLTLWCLGSWIYGLVLPTARWAPTCSDPGRPGGPSRPSPSSSTVSGPKS